MPLVNDEALRSLLVDGSIGAVTVDTNIFDEKKLQLSSPTLQAFSSFREKPFSFVLTKTVELEVLSHLESELEAALRAAKKEIGRALFAFDTTQPARDDLLHQISGGSTAAERARNRLDKYINDTGCAILDDPHMIDIVSIYTDYFSGNAPFGAGKKKTEFPDAFALHALERHARNSQIGILVVSKDQGWRDFCSTSRTLYLVDEVEHALALINNAPIGLKTRIQKWLSEDDAGFDSLVDHLEFAVGELDFSVDAHASAGELQAYSSTGTLKHIYWPDESDINIIDSTQSEDGKILKVTVSIPLLLKIEVPIELEFSVWDGIDKEYIDMGGRTIEVDQEIDTRVAISIEITDTDTTDGIHIVAIELEDRSHHIHLGEVDMFDFVDYSEDET